MSGATTTYNATLRVLDPEGPDRTLHLGPVTRNGAQAAASAAILRHLGPGREPEHWTLTYQMPDSPRLGTRAARTYLGLTAFGEPLYVLRLVGAKGATDGED